jgi:hypothetical protein
MTSVAEMMREFDRVPLYLPAQGPDGKWRVVSTSLLVHHICT